jgi:ABC-type transporter Mla maintaining outer membrane lipid asymmetry ATPase subunit MlaF
MNRKWAAGATFSRRAGGVDMAFDRQVFGGLSRVRGGQGIGDPRRRGSKSTILRLIGGLVRPQAGHTSSPVRTSRASPSVSSTASAEARDDVPGRRALDSLTSRQPRLPLHEHTSLDDDVAAAKVFGGSTGRLTDVRGPPEPALGRMLRRAGASRDHPDLVIKKLATRAASGLDPVSVKRIENPLVQINQRLGITIVLVSHHRPHDADGRSRRAAVAERRSPPGDDRGRGLARRLRRV